MVNTREIAEEYRLSHWTKIMRERTESGLSIKAFCQREGMNANTYFYWQRKLREAACQGLPTTSRNNAAKELVPSGWAVCSVADTNTKEPPVSIEIGKGKITVEAGFDPELLTKVCRVLTSLC